MNSMFWRFGPVFLLIMVSILIEKYANSTNWTPQFTKKGVVKEIIYRFQAVAPPTPNSHWNLLSSKWTLIAPRYILPLALLWLLHKLPVGAKELFFFKYSHASWSFVVLINVPAGSQLMHYKDISCKNVRNKLCWGRSGRFPALSGMGRYLVMRGGCQNKQRVRMLLSFMPAMALG